MSLLDEVLDHNAEWVKQRQTPPKTPSRKAAIFTCMDTRLIDFLEPAMGLKRGDATLIKNAGATLLDPGGGVVRSLVAAIFALGCEEILVIAHRDCGMTRLDEGQLRGAMLEQGVPVEAIDALKPSLTEWLGAFHDPVGNVERVVAALRRNPLIPKRVPIHGLVVDPVSGLLSRVVDGYDAVAA